MRGSHRVGNLVLGLRAWVLGLLVVMLASASVQAQSPGSGKVDVVPQTNRWVRSWGGGFETHASAMARYQRAAEAAAQTTYHRVPVSASTATLGRLTKGAVKRVAGPVGWYFLFRDLVDGAGWVIDELNKQVQTPGVPAQPLSGDVAYCSNENAVPGTGASRQYCVSTPEAVPQAFNRVMGRFGYQVISADAPNPGVRVWIRRVADGVSFGSVYFGRVPIAAWTPAQREAANENYHEDAEEISDQQIGDLVANHPDIVNGVLVDPQTGAPIQYPELVDAMNKLRKQLEQQHGLEPGPDVVPKPDYENQPQPSESEWPGFCDWASVVCEFIDWVKKDDTEEKELPEQELDIDPNSWSSGLGGGTCPAPESFTVEVAGISGTAEFPWEPLCQGATFLRPAFIAAASIIAVFILAGLRGSDNK